MGFTSNPEKSFLYKWKIIKNKKKCNFVYAFQL